MKPVNQTITDSQRGNCLQAAVASLFELELDEVPHFIDYGEEWWSVLQDWAAQHNLVVMYHTDPPFGCYTIMSGISPRDSNERHAVIRGPSGHIIHDPHPTKAGLASGPYYFYWFVVKNPALLHKMP